jgi:hypothetical protein
MTHIQYDFDIDGALHENPFLDRYELHLMFEQTKQSLHKALARKLGDMTCGEHGEAATITISGRYDAEREEMDIQYHIDTCCKLFTVRVVKTLNSVN